MKRVNFFSSQILASRNSRLLHFFDEIFFPCRCLTCSILLAEEDGFFCRSCSERFQLVTASAYKVCRICGEPFDGVSIAGAVCENCLRRPPSYTFCRSLFLYNEVMQKLILQFKFRQDRLVLEGIRQLCQSVELTEFAKADIVAPVPLHPVRLRKRGFNQSYLLCNLLFLDNKETKDVKIVSKLLERIQNTPAQRRLSRKERLKNLHKMFRVCGEISLKGKRICLVDDVITTGATVNECSDTLVKSGCSEVFVLTLARAVCKKKRDG